MEGEKGVREGDEIIKGGKREGGGGGGGGGVSETVREIITKCSC